MPSGNARAFETEFDPRSRLLYNTYSTWIEALCSGKQIVRSSGDSFVILHAETMHRAMPLTKPNGVFRLIYNFIDWYKERRRIKGPGETRLHIDDELVKQDRNRLQTIKLWSLDNQLWVCA